MSWPPTNPPKPPPAVGEFLASLADRAIGAHLLAAITRHQKACRTNGNMPPSGLDAVMRFIAACATDGPDGTNVADRHDGRDSRDMTSTALLTKGQAAQQLGCSQRTVTRLVEAGELQAVYVTARTPRFRPVDVESFIARKGLRGC